MQESNIWINHWLEEYWNVFAKVLFDGSVLHNNWGKKSSQSPRGKQRNKGKLTGDFLLSLTRAKNVLLFQRPGAWSRSDPCSHHKSHKSKANEENSIRLFAPFLVHSQEGKWSKVWKASHRVIRSCFSNDKNVSRKTFLQHILQPGTNNLPNYPCSLQTYPPLSWCSLG